MLICSCEQHQRLEWLKESFDDFQKNHWAIADCDEVKYFVNWLINRPEKSEKKEYYGKISTN